MMAQKSRIVAQTCLSAVTPTFQSASLRREFSGLFPKLVFILILFLGQGLLFAQSARTTMPFDEDWLFFKGDAKELEKPALDDAKWQVLNVPHDWSIEGTFAPKNPSGPDGAFLPSGVAWYRKKFTLPVEQAQRRVFIEFDGVMANSDVWINGFHLGKRPSGYVSFCYELTGRLHFGSATNNVIAVRTDTSAQPASTAYTGAGIYRHVRLLFTDALHVAQWGIYPTARLTNEQAVVHVQSTVVNQSSAARETRVRANLFGPGGQFIQLAESRPQIVPPGKLAEFHQDISVLNPQLWDLEHANLYRIVVSVHSGGATVDSDVVPFGIREVRFDPTGGFTLNGKVTPLKGVCLQPDGGAMGMAVPNGIWEQRLQQLKFIGCNAIRTANHPIAPEFLDLCDRMGFLVVDEIFDGWAVGKKPYDDHLSFKDWSKIDLRDTLCRDRNHPCVIAYSLGNEIRDNSANAKRILSGLREVCRQYDPAKVVTMGLSRGNGSSLNDLLDVVGHDYNDIEPKPSRKASKPTRKVLLTESTGGRKDWMAVRNNQFLGMFIWTGVDFLGGSPKWPLIGMDTGLLDRTGNLRPQAHEVRSWWVEQPVVYISRKLPSGVYVADWTPKNNTPHTELVEVFSNCEQVELFLNEKSLGTQTRAADETRSWRVSYEPGVLKAIGRNFNLPVAGHELKTAGEPAAITLATSSSTLCEGWDEVACVRALVIDKDGVVVPGATNAITFNLSGPGIIAAVDNGDNTSHEPFKGTGRQAYKGQCAAIVKATAAEGEIVMTATAPGLTDGTVTIAAAKKSFQSAP